MARIKTREVDRTSIKTANRTVSASHRIRHAAAEAGRMGKRQTEVQEQSVNEYSTARAEEGMEKASWKAEHIAEVGIARTSKYAKEKLRERKLRTETAAFDVDMTAYAEDYGMQKLLPEGKSHVDMPYVRGRDLPEPQKRMYADGRQSSLAGNGTGRQISRGSVKPKAESAGVKESSMQVRNRQRIKTTERVKPGSAATGHGRSSAGMTAYRKPQEAMRSASKKSYQAVKQGGTTVKQLAETVERSAKAMFFSAKTLIAAIAGGGTVAVVIIVICCFLGCIMYFSEGEGGADYKPMIVTVAETQVGNEGGEPFWSWYGFEERVDWCAIFVSWCGEQCGYLDAEILPKFAVVGDGAEWFKEKRQWKSGRYTPKAGDIIFFDWEDDGVMDHVGIVEKCENRIVYTIEGNSGDVCRKLQYPLRSEKVCGYGVPVYGSVTEEDIEKTLEGEKKDQGGE